MDAGYSNGHQIAGVSLHHALKKFDESHNKSASGHKGKMTGTIDNNTLPLMLARNGVYGPAMRAYVIMQMANNPNTALLLPSVTDVPAPDYAAERRRLQMEHRPQDTTQSPNDVSTLADRLTGKLGGDEKRNSEGDTYSGERYLKTAYADPSKKQSGIIYLSKGAFRKMLGAAAKLRSVYQRGEENSNTVQAGYDPLRSGNTQQADVLPFPSRKNHGPKNQIPYRTNQTIDDIAA